MATVLIIATDQLIGGLLGQLTDLTGHAAQFRRRDEEPSEAVRSIRPDVVLLDTAYNRTAIDRIAEAAAAVGAPVVYFAAAVPASELRRFAFERGAKYFPLPAGPKLLSRVLASALTTGPVDADSSAESPCRYAVAAAVAAVTRARLLVARAASIRTESFSVRAEHEAALADCRRSQAELREAVIAYTRELRGAGTPPDRALELVKNALRADAAAGPSTPDIDRDLDDAVEWCLQAYYAA
jgi:DNA-binding response OmpR family regulator